MIFLAFIVFITVRGELPTYLSLLRGSGNATTSTGVSVTGSDPIGSAAANGIGNVLSNINGAQSGSMSLENAQKLLDLFGG